MLTIKVFLTSGGRIADLKKDFPLYQGQFQNKLLNIYVPTAILAPDFTVSSTDSAVGSPYVAGTAVRIGCESTLSTGRKAVSKNYYMRYLKTLTVGGVEYALFERKLPKEFTTYAGQGANSPIMVINVVTVDTSSDPALVTSVVTSQQCALEVMPSTDLDADSAIEATDLEEINAEITAINTALDGKQNKKDSSIFAYTTGDRYVVGALNNLDGRVKTLRSDVDSAFEDISGNAEKIAQLENIIGVGEYYVGTLTGSSLSASTLDSFVQEKEGRAPRGGDVVIVIFQRDGYADQTFKCIYNGTAWIKYQIPFTALSGNGIAGLVNGTYGIGKTYSTLVDIVGGEIKNIYVLDKATQTYRSVKEWLDQTKTDIAAIVSGETVVGAALKATQDALGNDIVGTYLTKELGATKEYVQDYALPKEFNDVMYMTADVYSKTVPTSATPIATAKDFTLGDTTIISCAYILDDVKFELSEKNSCTNKVYLSCIPTRRFSLRLTTYAKKAGEEEVLLGVSLSDEIDFKYNSVQSVSFDTVFSELGNTVLSLVSGDQIRQELEVISTTVETSSMYLYSNTTSPSTLYLNTGTQTITVAAGLLGEQENIFGSNPVISNNAVYYTISDDTKLNLNSEVAVSISALPTGADGLPVYLRYTTGSEIVYLISPYSQSKSIDSTALKQLKQASGGYFFKGYVQSGFHKKYILVDMDNLSGVATEAAITEAVNASVGKINQLGFNATLSGETITGTLDSSIANFELKNSTQYVFNVHLAVAGEIPDNAKIVLTDKDGHTININSVFVDDTTKSTSVARFKQIEQYDTESGYVWEFSGVYHEYTENNATVRVVYTDTLVNIKEILYKQAYESGSAPTVGQVLTLTNTNFTRYPFVGDTFQLLETVNTTDSYESICEILTVSATTCTAKILATTDITGGVNIKAQGYANTAETNAKAYTDEQVGNINTILETLDTGTGV